MLSKVIEGVRQFKLSILAGKANTQLSKGNYAASRRMISELMQSNPREDLVIVALSQLGEVSFHEEKYAEAIESLEKAIRMIERLPKYDKEELVLNRKISEMEHLIEIARTKSKNT